MKPPLDRGFTLIELLVVISIIGMLASVVLVAVSGARSKAIIGAATEFDTTNYHALGADAVAIWPLNGDGKDQSIYGNDLTTIQNASWSNTSYNGYSSLQLTSASSVYATNPKGLPTTAVTVSAWVYVTANANWLDYVSNNWGTSGGWLLFSAANGDVYFGIRDSTLSQIYATASGALKPNQWYNLTGTYDGSRIDLYINGVKTPSYVTLAGMPLYSGTGVLQLGPFQAGPTINMQNVRIYGRALVGREVREIFAEGAVAHGIALK